MNLFTRNSGMTKCQFKTWEKQEKCKLENVKKSRFSNRCTWLWWYDEETCTNPAAIKGE